MFLFLVVITIVCYVLFQLKKYSILNKYPGPSSFELFKFFLLPKPNEDTYRYIISLPEKYGPVVKLWVKPFKPTLLVSDPIFFERILWSKNHLHKSSFYNLLRDIAGTGLLINPDLASWKHERKLFGPAFNHTATSQYSPQFKHHTDKLKEFLESHENEVVNVQPLIHRFGFDIIIEYLFDKNISDQENVATGMMTALETSLGIVLERANSFYKFNDTIFRFTKNYGKWCKANESLQKYMDGIFRQQMEMRKNNTAKNTHFLDLLLNSGLSFDSMIANAKSFILAGLETTGQAVSFALFELSKRPDIQEKIFKEYTSIIGKDRHAAATFHDLKNMIYTECVAKETLRLYPVVPLLQRTLKEPVIIDGTTIPSGVDLIFSLETLQKSPKYDRPLEFDPDRFLPENTAKLPPYSYAPFSAGPRDCIGKKIGLLEMKILISFIVRHFTLHTVHPDVKLQVIGEMTLKSKNDVPVIFRRRS